MRAGISDDLIDGSCTLYGIPRWLSVVVRIIPKCNFERLVICPHKAVSAGSIGQM